jgi:phenylpyruvate tautomerase PptA (4-oxalocrotonate tautomerase family)
MPLGQIGVPEGALTPEQKQQPVSPVTGAVIGIATALGT